MLICNVGFVLKNHLEITASSDRLSTRFQDRIAALLVLCSAGQEFCRADPLLPVLAPITVTPIALL